MRTTFRVWLLAVGGLIGFAVPVQAGHLGACRYPRACITPDQCAPAPVESMPAARDTARPGGKWLPDARPIAVGFVAGMLVMLFGMLQIREFRRRHAGAAATKSEG